jgi:hypothetical protein
MGRYFEADVGATLPFACVRCGAPVDPPVRRCVFNPPGRGFLFDLGKPWWWLLLAPRPKTFEIGVPICARHLARRRRLRWIGWSLVAAMTVLPIACFQSSNEDVQNVGCCGAGALAALVVLGIGERTIRATEITERFARFAGADERFLALLERTVSPDVAAEGPRRP